MDNDRLIDRAPLIAEEYVNITTRSSNTQHSAALILSNAVKLRPLLDLVQFGII
jgi:hypothetical protein